VFTPKYRKKVLFGQIRRHLGHCIPQCRIDPERSPYSCVLSEHKPVRRGREMIEAARGGAAEA
jgi:hypothetical protein